VMERPVAAITVLQTTYIVPRGADDTRRASHLHSTLCTRRTKWRHGRGGWEPRAACTGLAVEIRERMAHGL
jgi:hypothetical protein